MSKAKGGCARRRLRRRRARLRAPRRDRRGPARPAARGADRARADGPGEPRLRVRRQLLGACSPRGSSRAAAAPSRGRARSRGCSPWRRSEKRGELLGTAIGAAVFGALFGPVIGAAAALLGRSVVFTALAGLAVVLGAWALRLDDARAEEPSQGRARRARCATGASSPVSVLMTLPALLFGILSVLGPLHLSDAGWGAAAIGGVWLFAAPRSSRSRGRSSAGSSTAAAACSRCGSRSPRAWSCRSLSRSADARSSTSRCSCWRVSRTGCSSPPAFALLADGADAVGLAQGMAFGLMNAAWATGAVVGPAAGGAIAGATGDSSRSCLRPSCARPCSWSCVRARDAKAPRFRPGKL